VQLKTSTQTELRPNEGDGQMIAQLSTTTDDDYIASATGAGHDEDGAIAPELAATDSGWWAHARCNDGAGQLNELFFSDELQDIARAKHICATCPALIPCLEGALERREPWGVWGGQLFLNGKILANKRRRGRPPKVARPEDQLPDIPIPEHLLDVAVIRIA
jgi:WhiB family redox-sensing transcriptional regulator